MSENWNKLSIVCVLFFVMVCQQSWGYEIVKNDDSSEYMVDFDINKMHQIFVAQDGDDNNIGTKQKPLATLAGARDRIRQLMADINSPKNGVVVQIRGGSYFFDETLHLTQMDSGTQSASIIYQNFRNEKVR